LDIINVHHSTVHHRHEKRIAITAVIYVGLNRRNTALPTESLSKGSSIYNTGCTKCSQIFPPPQRQQRQNRMPADAHGVRRPPSAKVVLTPSELFKTMISPGGATVEGTKDKPSFPHPVQRQRVLKAMPDPAKLPSPERVLLSQQTQNPGLCPVR
jgi:hypothetical protein